MVSTKVDTSNFIIRAADWDGPVVDTSKFHDSVRSHEEAHAQDAQATCYRAVVLVADMEQAEEFGCFTSRLSLARVTFIMRGTLRDDTTVPVPFVHPDRTDAVPKIIGCLHRHWKEGDGEVSCPALRTRKAVNMRGHAPETVVIRVSWYRDVLDEKAWADIVNNPRRAIGGWVGESVRCLMEPLLTCGVRRSRKDPSTNSTASPVSRASRKMRSTT